MKWLTLTDNKSFTEDLQKLLLSKDKKNKLVISSLNIEELKKLKKNLADFSGCFLFANKLSEKDNISLLQISGFFAAYKIPFLICTKNNYENTLFEKEGLKSFESKEELLSYFDKNFKKISKESIQRLAKKKLLDRGIPFTGDCFGTYIAKNKIEIVNEFLEAGMSVNSRDDMGVPMLNIACRNDNFEFVEMLLNLGAELNASSDDRGYTAVMDAVWRGNEKITKMLIDKGADLNTINKEGQTNLILAVGADRLSLVKLLAENGADPDVKDMMGMSAYTYSILFKKDKIAEVLKTYHKDS